MSWHQYRAELAAAMEGLATDVPLMDLAQMSALAECLHFHGNGASATMASHMATDWMRRGKIPALTYSDAAWITATANDAGYERVFADTLLLARPDDLVCCISSSGRSPNIVRCAVEARARGLRVVTLSGMTPDNPLRELGTANVYVPSLKYGIVESVHAAFLHAWLDCYCEIFLDKPSLAGESFRTS